MTSVMVINALILPALLRRPGGVLDHQRRVDVGCVGPRQVQLTGTDAALRAS
jgi:hypothetical protein